MTRLDPLKGAARSIKNRLDAHAVNIVFFEDDKDHPDGISVMAEFKSASDRLNYLVHIEKLPLRRDWMERAISNLKREKERA